MDRYEQPVRDLRRLFVFHGLRCGEAASFGALGAKLGESRAFRTDVTAMVRAVRDGEHGTMAAREMLTVVALAAGGEDLVEGRMEAAGMPQALGALWVMLDGMGGWREMEGGAELADVATEAPVEQGLKMELEPGLRNGVREWPAGDWAGDWAGSPASPEVARAEAVVAGPKDRVELAIQELKVYLDDMERRMSRLEPHVEDLSQTVEDSRERLERLRREHAEALASGAEQRPELHADAGHQEVAPVGERRGLAEMLVRADRAARGNGENGTDGWRGLGGAGRLEQDAPERHTGAETREMDGRFSRGMTAAAPAAGWWEAVSEAHVEKSVDDAAEVASVREAAARTQTPVVPRPLAAVPRESHQGMAPAPVDWRQRVGVWSGAVAVLFAVLGLGGLWYMTGRPTAAPAGTQTVAQNQERPLVAAPAPTPVPAAEPVISKTAEPVSPKAAEPVVPKAAESASPAASKAAKLGAPAVAAAPVARVLGERKQAPPVEARVEEPRKLSAPAGRGAGGDGTAVRAPAVAAAARRPVVVASAAPAPAVTAPTPAQPLSPGGGTVVAAGTRPVVEVRSSGAKVLESRRPVYPAEALRAHTEATVVLNAFLSKDGTVRRMDVVKGAYGFNRSAMDAIWGWRYQPLVVHGQPVETEAQITVDYRLRPSETN